MALPHSRQQPCTPRQEAQTILHDDTVLVAAHLVNETTSVARAATLSTTLEVDDEDTSVVRVDLSGEVVPGVSTTSLAPYPLLHHLRDGRLDLRLPVGRVDALAGDDAELVETGALAVRDGLLDLLKRLLHIQAVQVDRARRLRLVVL